MYPMPYAKLIRYLCVIFPRLHLNETIAQLRFENVTNKYVPKITLADNVLEL